MIKKEDLKNLSKDELMQMHKEIENKISLIDGQIDKLEAEKRSILKEIKLRRILE